MTANENLRPGRDQKPLCRQGDTPVALVVLNLRGRLARLPGPRYSGCLLSRSGFVRRWAVGEAGRWCSVWQDAVDNLTVAEADIAARDTRLGFAEDDIDGLEALFVGVSRGLDEFTFLDTVVFSDMNLQVVNGNGPFFFAALLPYTVWGISSSATMSRSTQAALVISLTHRSRVPSCPRQAQRERPTIS